MRKLPINTLLCLLFILILNGCDNGSSSVGGSGGQVVSDTELVGPDLNGNDWAGHYKSIKGKYIALTAVIQHIGDRVTIQTSIPSGVASRLTGTIDAKGRMMMYDAYDNQAWTTHYRPVSDSSITLADYVFKDNQRSDTNILSLKR